MIALATGVAAASAVLSYLTIRWSRPWLVSVALAKPNARSSHTVPTPQGGGLAVVGAALVAWTLALLVGGHAFTPTALAAVGGALVLGAIGFRDDVRPVSAGLRLVIQFACVAPLVWLTLLMPGTRPSPSVFALCTILTVAGVWWVNLVNFMDGVDWMTVSATVPLCAALAGFGLAGQLDPTATPAAAALLGGILGFAPANRPVARLFLGDVGSLPVGLLTGWLLLELARSGAVAAALLLPLYYGADATVTLLARVRRGERLSEAHRDHFYQRAHRAGWRVTAIDARVFGLNVALALLAAATLAWPGLPASLAAFAAGGALVGWTLRDFTRPPPARAVSRRDGP